MTRPKEGVVVLTRCVIAGAVGAKVTKGNTFAKAAAMQVRSRNQKGRKKQASSRVFDRNCQSPSPKGTCDSLCEVGRLLPFALGRGRHGRRWYLNGTRGVDRLSLVVWPR